jgi:hypothetical protein
MLGTSFSDVKLKMTFRPETHVVICANRPLRPSFLRPKVAKGSHRGNVILSQRNYIG